ncbi:hypothetical protein [Streptomyces sp. TRM68367]|uniref:hypothetical protein n=1 Tax=Streptomyces sp. TRM68367 TaxID=2758415 RepID=UPI00165C0962|nr:hypothetical protein [Streptomyces sp. TRM68367]MBC9731406.1 hypothetical protein [Streptomyces sp. TRM68367]
MPSVIALLELREARAREELESWLEVVKEAEEQAAAARQRLEHARIACGEVLRALAEEAECVAGRVQAGQETLAVPDTGDDVSPRALAFAQDAATAAAPALVLRPGYDPRPPVWQAGMDDQSLSGVYRQVFAAVMAAAGPVSAQELTRALGRDASRLNEVEKVRHRAYALQARGWLVRERGVFTPAAGPAGAAGTRASAGAGAPSDASA